MGMNLSAPRRTPGPPGSPGRQSSLQQQDLIVITDYYRGPKCKNAQNYPNKIQLTTKPTLTRRA